MTVKKDCLLLGKYDAPICFPGIPQSHREKPGLSYLLFGLVVDKAEVAEVDVHYLARFRNSYDSGLRLYFKSAMHIPAQGRLGTRNSL